MLDFRYRVTDSERAAPFYDRKNSAYLIDEEAGVTLSVPRTAKAGPLRQTNFVPDPDRVYFILFGNPGGLVQPGKMVTVAVGGCRIENVKVE